jgi:hypothetical protein
MLKFLQEFLEVVFLGILMKSVLDDPRVWSATPRSRQEYRLKRSITLDPTVGSSSNLYRSLWRLVSLASQ